MLGRFDYTQISHAGYLKLIGIQNDVIVNDFPKGCGLALG